MSPVGFVEVTGWPTGRRFYIASRMIQAVIEQDTGASVMMRSGDQYRTQEPAHVVVERIRFAAPKEGR